MPTVSSGGYFVSYRRGDARNSALQLFNALSGRLFDVFLDTHGVAPLRWETKPFRLWERILADNAKAEFIVAGIGKPREGGASYYLMQFIHHVVMTTYKSSINPGRLQYR